MLALLIFFVVFLLLSIRIYKQKGLTPSLFLYVLYTLSGFASLILMLFYGYGENRYIGDYNGGVLFLLLALLLFLYPFLEIKDGNIISITLPVSSIFKPFAWMLTVLSWFSIFYFIPIAKSMLFVNIADVASLRNAVARGENPFITESIFNTIAGTAASFYMLELLFFFLVILEKKKITISSIIILLGSFSYPLFVLAYLGRDGILFWFFSFISYFLLFYRYLPIVVIKRLKKLGIFVSLPFIAIFLFITIGRFVVSGNSDDVFYPIVNYLGQGPINFAELYYTGIQKLGYGSNIFPLLFNSDNVDINYALDRYDLKSWVFKTFVSSIYIDFGTVLTLVIGILLIFMFRFFYLSDKRKSNFSFSLLIMYSLFFTIYSQGVFYFRQGYNAGNLFIISMLLFALFFAYLPKKKIVL